MEPRAFACHTHSELHSRPSWKAFLFVIIVCLGWRPQNMNMFHTQIKKPGRAVSLSSAPFQSYPPPRLSQPSHLEIPPWFTLSWHLLHYLNSWLKKSPITIWLHPSGPLKCHAPWTLRPLSLRTVSSSVLSLSRACDPPLRFAVPFLPIASVPAASTLALWLLRSPPLALSCGFIEPISYWLFLFGVWALRPELAASPVLTCLGCCNKIPKMGQLIHSRGSISHNSRGWEAQD